MYLVSRALTVLVIRYAHHASTIPTTPNRNDAADEYDLASAAGMIRCLGLHHRHCAQRLEPTFYHCPTICLLRGLSDHRTYLSRT